MKRNGSFDIALQLSHASRSAIIVSLISLLVLFAMSLEEIPEYNPDDIEKYVVANMMFFKHWVFNNITLNQLNTILIEQQMMPATTQTTSGSTRVGFSLGVKKDKEGGEKDEGKDTSPTSKLVG